MLLVLLCAAVYVPGLAALQPVDRDECRFAQSSRQMFESLTLEPKGNNAPNASGARQMARDPDLHSGGLAIPMYAQTPRLNKPPLTYWLQVCSAWVFTGGDASADAMWMYRLPSAVCAMLSVLTLWRMGMGMFDPRVAVMGAALLAVSPMVVWDAHQARSDQLLLLTVTVAQLALWRVWTALPQHTHWQSFRVRWFFPTLFWAAITAGILAKGPITPMVLGLTVMFLGWFGRDWSPVKRLRWPLGLAFLLLAVGAWAGVVVQHFGLANYLEILNREVLLRATVGSVEGHFAPPGTHTVLLAVLMWPGSLLTAWGVLRAVKLGLPRREQVNAPASVTGRIVRTIFDRQKGRRGEFYCLAWLLPGWIVFELVTSKLPHYTMPMYPAAALLSARALFAAGAMVRRGDRSMITRLGLGVWHLIGLAPLACFGMMVILLGRGLVSAEQTVILGVAAALSATLGIAATRSVWRGQVVRGQIISIAAAIVGLAATLHLFAPAVAPGQGTARLMAAVEAVESYHKRPIASLYGEDSIVFWTRGRVARIDESKLQAWIEANPTGIVIAPEALRAALFARGFVAGEAVDVSLPPPLGSPKLFIVAGKMIAAEINKQQ